MREIILIRHGVTEWNQLNRIQGQTDIPLATEGEAQCRQWRLPKHYADAAWYASTLSRTHQTAHLMGCQKLIQCAELMEMNWGEWTGKKIADLRRELGEAMAVNESRGLDFQPPGGESPRIVRSRFQQWLQHLEPEGPAVVGVTHRGVIRAAISHATGWDLTQDFGEKLKRAVYHRFTLLDDGKFQLEQLNEPLQIET